MRTAQSSQKSLKTAPKPGCKSLTPHQIPSKMSCPIMTMFFDAFFKGR